MKVVAPSISLATVDEAPQLAELHAEALPPGWSAADFAAYCGKVNRVVFKASIGGVCDGLAVLHYAGGEAEVLTLAVGAEKRRLGIASSLLDAIIGACKAKEIGCIYLEVAHSNYPARNLYGKFGFRQIATRENYYHTPIAEAALIMKLNIDYTGS
jgi:[ribosomal protein S18]-alanine N-acetyltransferase